MPSYSYDLDRPSGAVLPLVLRRKWRKQEAEGIKGSSDSTSPTTQADDKDILCQPPPSALANSVFTAEELEERILRASAAMVDIQKQLTRGEESYFEDTNAHGNIYRGWDMFIDAKDVNGNGGSGAQSAGTGGGSRRIPADHRWFSGSCRSVTTRGVRPASLYTSKSSVLSSSAPPSRSTTPSNNAAVVDNKTPPSQEGRFSELTVGVVFDSKISNLSEASIPKAEAASSEAAPDELNTSSSVAGGGGDVHAVKKDEEKTTQTGESGQNKDAGKADSSEKKEEKSEQSAKSGTAKKREAPTTPRGDNEATPGIRLSTRKKQKVEITTFDKFP